jgi:undecaprenyl-diphosphatase
MTRVAALGGAITLALGVFIAVTQEAIVEHEVWSLDRTMLIGIARWRTPTMTGAMVDVTALGSPTIVASFAVIVFASLVAMRDRRGAVQVAIASAGAWLLTVVTKGIIERQRPTIVAHLVEISGTSYPSGHSLSAAALYLTFALVAVGHMRAATSRVVVIVSALTLVSMVGFSRVYLGVHYPSDVIAGVALGIAWALILAAVIGALVMRSRSSSRDNR